MKAAEIFDVCYGRYRGLKRFVENGRGAVRSLNLEVPSLGYRWKPERTRASEFVADFERIGRLALRRREWKGRLKLFEIYFLGSVEYRRAITLVGVSEGTFDYWFQEVKAAVGRECARTGLFPPFRYFQTAHRRKDWPAGRSSSTEISPKRRSIQRAPARSPAMDAASAN